ncbi:MAG: response regulator transcription factor [Clostridia bacterium]|nr:response regulator transcription factor [Clostridia bacterium]
MIYLLEDDASIRKLVIYALQSQGWEAEGFERPSLMREALKDRLPELLLLDIMLPEEDGISVLRSLRQKHETAGLPVILLTARTAEYDRVEGLDSGADDYIVKPFGMMELLARVRAVLRRSSSQRSEEPELVSGAIRLSQPRHEASCAGEPLSLTNKEFDLLRLLMENEGLVLDRSRLLDEIWGLGSEPENRTLDVHIRSLRAKLEAEGERIETVRGVGYRLREAAE